MPSFYEFFAGGGMARAGLGRGWTCLFANDIDPKKAASYALNWGADHLRIADIAALTTADMPGRADLAWASFPCQDLSLAGSGAGLNGSRSGTFWPFWNHIKTLAREGRNPSLIVLENVCGAITSHEGRDFAAIGNAIAEAGYRFGAIVIDAVHFLPQSRPRLFVIGVREDRTIPQQVVAPCAVKSWHPASMAGAHEKLSETSKSSWLWWNLPTPPQRMRTFGSLIESDPKGVVWHTPTETQRLLSMMTPLNREKVEKARRTNRSTVGGIYKRTRASGDGKRSQRAEVRFDDVAGCLRTPGGGSSRQTILVVDGDKVSSRLLSPREAARLMGLPESYQLPRNYNDGYRLAGDGLAVPVVRFLSTHLLEPLLAAPKRRNREVA